MSRQCGFVLKRNTCHLPEYSLPEEFKCTEVGVELLLVPRDKDVLVWFQIQPRGGNGIQVWQFRRQGQLLCRDCT